MTNSGQFCKSIFDEWAELSEQCQFERFALVFIFLACLDGFIPLMPGFQVLLTYYCILEIITILTFVFGASSCSLNFLFPRQANASQEAKEAYLISLVDIGKVMDLCLSSHALFSHSQIALVARIHSYQAKFSLRGCALACCYISGQCPCQQLLSACVYYVRRLTTIARSPQQNCSSGKE